MMKKLIGIAFITVLYSLTVNAEQAVVKFSTGQFVFSEHNLTLNVEVAKNTKQRAIGLMYREKLAANKGMLFIFEDEAVQRIWMKNTLIPLDVLFISAENRIVSMIKNIQPCRQNPCAIYNSNQKAKYMLEINAGFVEDKNIAVVEKVRFSFF